MHKYLTLVPVAALAGLAACAGGSAGTPISPSLGASSAPLFSGEFASRVKTLPKNTIGEELPSEGVGTEKDPTWGTVGGFTQTSHAQVLAFKTGTRITIRNLSSELPHTLDVVKLAGKPPARFPSNPTLSFSAEGGGHLGVGYASGTLEPGKSVTVVLSKPGTYLIGCAFHYSEGMRDVIIVSANPKPGPFEVR
jgi:plastocyanin